MNWNAIFHQYEDTIKVGNAKARLVFIPEGGSLDVSPQERYFKHLKLESLVSEAKQYVVKNLNHLEGERIFFEDLKLSVIEIPASIQVNIWFCCKKLKGCVVVRYDSDRFIDYNIVG